jgi:hypothetical protein
VQTIGYPAQTEPSFRAIQDVPVGSILPHRPNTELFLELTLTQACPFPAGDYLINYVVKDGVY